MNGRVFIDTNVLLYAYDSRAGQKQQVAQTVLSDLWAHQTGVLSMQVLQEFYVNVTRKLAKPLERPVARTIFDRYSLWCVDTAPTDIVKAFSIEDSARINFWDALIVASALKGGASTILSEDLNHGQTIAGILIENPFAS